MNNSKINVAIPQFPHFSPEQDGCCQGCAAGWMWTSPGCTHSPARSRMGSRAWKEIGILDVFILLLKCLLLPLTLQPWVHYSLRVWNWNYEGKKILHAFTWIHYLSSDIEGINWEGNFKTILLTWVTGVSYQKPCQRHCSWQETYSIFMILPFIKSKP